MNRNIIVFLLFLTVVIVACKLSTTHHIEQEKKELPKLDTAVNIQEQQYNLAVHYWDRTVQFSETISLTELTSFKYHLGDYIQLLNTFPLTQSKSLMRSFLTEKILSVGVLQKTERIFEEYLYDPVSPLRNDELYAVFLKYKMSFRGIEDIYLVRTRYQLNIISKNRVGQLAENFNYVTSNSKEASLFSIKSQYTLLYFYNPDCPYCKETKLKMGESSILQQLKSSPQKLCILAISIAPGKSKWLKYISTLPSHWVNGYNAEIPTQERYDLRAIPSLYLLDEHKKVICKDATFEQVENKLIELLQQ